jgi:hypothetical protein
MEDIANSLAVGEHSEAVLREADYTDAEIGMLRAEGMIA